MALKFSYPDNHGVTHADAYLKIDEILLGSADARVVYSVFIIRQQDQKLMLVIRN